MASSPLVDMSEQNLTTVLSELYPSLSLIETMELFAAINSTSLSSHLDRTAFMQAQKMQWNQRLQDLFELLAKTPATFKNWAHTKSMGIKDLQPLLSIDDVESITGELKILGDSQLSRNDGKSFIDLVVDLVMMKIDFSEVFTSPSQSWLSSLKKLRYPNATSQDLKASPSQIWPKYVQVVKQRQGDRVLNKMQITYADKTDLKEKLQRLQSRGESL